MSVGTTGNYLIESALRLDLMETASVSSKKVGSLKRRLALHQVHDIVGIAIVYKVFVLQGQHDLSKSSKKAKQSEPQAERDASGEKLRAKKGKKNGSLN